MRDCPDSVCERVMGAAFGVDVVFESCLLAGLEFVPELNGPHMSGIISSRRLLDFKRGYLMNFNMRHMAAGIRRL